MFVADMIQQADHDQAIFVPAVMSAGLVFSLVTIIRRLLHDRRRPLQRRRVSVAAAAIARHTASGAPATDVLDDALRPRLVYLLIGATGAGASIYIVAGSVLNYARADGYSSDIAWLLALSALTSVLFAGLGIVGLVLFVAWPHAPRWTTPLLVSSPLGHSPGSEVARPNRRFLLGWGLSVSTVLFGLLTLGVGSSRLAFQRTDEWIMHQVSGVGWIDDLAVLNLLGTTEIAVALALLVGVATLRCVPFAVVYFGSVVGTLAADTVVKVVVERPRPPGTTLSALTDSYPSGHLAQVVLITGFVPLAIEVLTDLRWHTHVIGAALAAVVVVAGLVRIDEGVHWPTDVLGGVLLGTVVSFYGHWLLESPRWHGRCHTCPWVPHDHRPLGAVHIPDGIADQLRHAAIVWSAIVIAGFAVLGAMRGIPRNPDNDLLGQQIEAPLTIVAMVVLVVAWGVAIHWNGAGAVGLVLGGSVLAILSSLAYHPGVSFLIVLAFLLPAIALWLAWQHDQSRRALTVLAGVTAVLLIGVYSASAAVYGHFFGSQHPQSETPALPVDRVDWVLAGAVRSDGFQVNASVGDADDHSGARLVVAGPDGHVVLTSAVKEIPDTGIVQFGADGLEPSTTYTYVLEVDGHPDDTRGRGWVRTFSDGAMDLRVAVSACARTGSNGSVFDAIAATEPDLYLVTGDLHYGNPDRPDPALFRRNFARVFTQSAPATIFRSTPFAYVWDDHDYGPNDADASSPTRDTARAVYREVVPNTAAPDGPINQAFTAGRVRFVLTDTRSARSDDSMLGEPQMRWFLDELRRADEYALVVWANPDPWIAPSDPSRDDWGAYPDDRQRIIDVIEQEAIDNLVMLSGDAHMVAIDDGTNSGGFPVLHAGALDRPGTVKGGPYSHGTYPGPGQFGLLEVDDDGGSRISVTLSGHRWDGQELVRHRFDVDVGSGVGNPTSSVRARG